MTVKAESSSTAGGQATDRRQFFGMMGAAVAAVSLDARAASSKVSSPIDQMIKLRASLDPRPVYMWLVGKRYLVLPDGRSQPLCGMANCSITRTRRKSAESFGLQVLEYNYNTDFDSGEWCDELVMPFNGRRVPSPVAKSEPVHHEWRWRYAYEGRLDAAGEFPPAAIERYGADAELSIDRRIHEAEILGEEIAFTQDWYLRVAPKSPGKKGWWVREISTVRGALRDALDAQKTYVPSRTSYSIIYDVLPWMQLDDVGGMVLTTATGGKATSAEDLPASIRRLFTQRNPEALGDPEKLLSP